MSIFNDLGKAFSQAMKPACGPDTSSADKEHHRVMREMDRNIASSRRIRTAADGVVARIAARGGHSP